MQIAPVVRNDDIIPPSLIRLLPDKKWSEGFNPPDLSLLLLNGSDSLFIKSHLTIVHIIVGSNDLNFSIGFHFS